jgi:hypothetical protein
VNTFVRRVSCSSTLALQQRVCAAQVTPCTLHKHVFALRDTRFESGKALTITAVKHSTDTCCVHHRLCYAVHVQQLTPS